MRLLILTLLLLVTTIASANPSSISWSAWEIDSSEELSQGVKYPQKWNAPRYPLTRLFDGDPKTAWVYNATSREFDTDDFKMRYGLQFNPQTPVLLDTIRIVNGQNVSSARFKANHRAKTVRVTLANGKIRRVYLRTLADRQGGQTLKFPPLRAKVITLEFPQITRSPNKSADFCLSEIELRKGGHKIPWNMPRLVMCSDGAESDVGADFLITRDGFPLTGPQTDAGYFADWSPSGRYIASVGGPEAKLYIYDAVRGTKISKTSDPALSRSDSKWLNHLSKDTTD